MWNQIWEIHPCSGGYPTSPPEKCGCNLSVQTQKKGQRGQEGESQPSWRRDIKHNRKTRTASTLMGHHWLMGQLLLTPEGVQIKKLPLEDHHLTSFPLLLLAKLLLFLSTSFWHTTLTHPVHLSLYHTLLYVHPISSDPNTTRMLITSHLQC